jgi:thiamine pyrophosphate-dependent acetolactate synthase large subunit-like protein
MTEHESCGRAVISLLEAYGVDTVFGMPGVHTLELYKGLAASRIRHILVRHEQGAGFMADGYARATGRPGVCVLITGPGVTNAATAMGQAYSDSVPMLVLSSVNASADLGMGRGRLHEITCQQAVTAPLTAFSGTALDAGEVPDLIARAFTAFTGARPRPVHIALPLDVLTAPADFAIQARPPRRCRRRRRMPLAQRPSCCVRHSGP